MLDGVTQTNTNLTISPEEEAAFLRAIDEVSGSIGMMILMPMLSDVMSEE